VPQVSERLAALGQPSLQLLRFSVVGGLGTVTNLVLFFFLVDVGGAAPLLGAVLCFAVAVSQNYVLNELWTFATSSGGGLSLDRYWKFVAASLLGLAINVAVLSALLWLYRFPLAVIPQALGIAAGMAFNFLASRQIVFRRGVPASGRGAAELAARQLRGQQDREPRETDRR
jgi:putative flippase GtrA